MKKQSIGNKIGRILAGVSGSFLVLFSIPLTTMMIYDFIVGTDELVGTVGVGGFSGVLSILGFLLLYLAIRKPAEKAPEIDEGTERMVLQLASINEGKLTQSHLAMESSLTLEQASKVLNKFERSGVAYSVLSRAGGTEYVFPDLAGVSNASHDQFLLDLNSSPAADLNQEAESEEVVENERGAGL